MRLLLAIFLSMFLAIISLAYSLNEELEKSIYYKQKYKEINEAYLKASTLLKYHDSINNSGLIINLSKYQLEYIKREIDKIK